MYVTRPLSYYRNNPESLSLPLEGPNLGYLVIQDEESVIYSCLGLCKDTDKFLNDLPFPQNKNLTTEYVENFNRVKFFPVLNQPLSSNLYYVIELHGKHKGKAYACSKEEDTSTCCFSTDVNDVKPRPFDPTDMYQQFEIANYKTQGSFYAKSVAQDAIPPYFLREKGWNISTTTPKNYTLSEALGLDSTLRAHLPDLSFPLSHKSSEVVVIGKWYCPFMFIKDGKLTSSGQMENSMFYEMTLEQRWEQIFESDNYGNIVMVDAVVQREVILVGGREAVWDEKDEVGTTKWFKSYGSKGEEVSVGLSCEIFERMKWEEERVGWVGGEDKEVKVSRVEEVPKDGGSLDAMFWWRVLC